MLLGDFIAIIVITSFAYWIGLGLGRISKDEIKKDKKSFQRLDLFLWVFFMVATIIFSLIENYYALIGLIAAVFVIMLAKRKIHHLLIIPLVLGLAASFQDAFFILLITIATAYILLYGAVKWHKGKKISKQVLRDQLTFIILGLVGVVLAVYLQTASPLIATFLASLVLIGNYTHRIVL